ncbi:MAG TPA: DUF2934 domain-containing protein [Gammaproteobacteria bacterium]
MNGSNEVSAERRRQMIAEAAYFRAQRRGFGGDEGDALRDWLEAEREVDEQLRRLEIERFVERLEEVLLAANKKLSTLKRKVAGKKEEARAEWQEDIEKLTALRDALRPKLERLRAEGERAGRQLREQAEKMLEDIGRIAQRRVGRG